MYMVGGRAVAVVRFHGMKRPRLATATTPAHPSKVPKIFAIRKKGRDANSK